MASRALETIVKDYVRERRLRRREMFVSLSHPPGHAQADFGEADAIIAGVKYRGAFFRHDTSPQRCLLRCGLPGDDGGLAGRAQQSLCFFRLALRGSILYDNDKCLRVAHLVRWHAATNAGV